MPAGGRGRLQLLPVVVLGKVRPARRPNLDFRSPRAFPGDFLLVAPTPITGGKT